MTPKKTTPLVLMIFTVMCALPVAAGAVSTAIAQEEETTSLEEDLASGIVSEVLDDSGNADEEENDGDAAGDDTNTQIAVPVTDEDQRAANLAANLAAQLDLDVTNVDEEQEEEVPPEEVPPEEVPPEEGVSFCFAIVGEPTDPRCFDTLLECQLTRGNEVPPPGTEFTPCVEVGPG
jgi:hypothetical protein